MAHCNYNGPIESAAAGNPAPACSARDAFLAWRGPRPTSELVDKREWAYDSELLWEAWRRGIEYAQKNNLSGRLPVGRQGGSRYAPELEVR